MLYVITYRIKSPCTAPDTVRRSVMVRYTLEAANFMAERLKDREPAIQLVLI